MLKGQWRMGFYVEDGYIWHRYQNLKHYTRKIMKLNNEAITNRMRFQYARVGA
jgi:hypothetical protein